MTLALASAFTLLTGCGKNDTISQAERSEINKPSIAETKAIAEELQAITHLKLEKQL